jgi:hypothetical protein
MNANIYGEIQFFTCIVVGADRSERMRKVKLGSVWCEYSERLEKADQFITANKHVKQIYAQFVFSESLDLAL